MTKPNHLALLLLVAIPLLLGLTKRALVYRGDTSAQAMHEAERHFTPKQIEAGRSYRRAYQPSGAAATLLYWALLGALLATPWTRRFVDRVEAQSGGRLWREVLVVTGSLYLALTLALFPIRFYQGYILEGRFGFRRLELGPWLLRELGRATVEFAVLYLVALAFFWAARKWRRWEWPVIGAGTTASLVGVLLWPIVILPLFYSITPVPEGELRDAIEALAAEAEVDVSEISMIDQSRVSGHTNAFFTGLGSERQIVLYDTLTEDHTTEEVMTVVAHEVGHWQHRHMLKGWLLGLLAGAAGVVLLRHVLDHAAVRRTFAIRGSGDLAILPLVWTAIMALNVYASPVHTAISRSMEAQADQASLALTGTPEIYIEMTKTSVRKNRSDVLRHPWVACWYGTHPTVLQRLAAAEAFER